MSKDEITLEQRWAINVDWLRKNSRSFTAMARGSLCPKCRKKTRADQVEVKPNELFKAIKNCCSKSVDFIPPTLPIHESIFRLLLANGNQPLTIEELASQLNQRRGTDTYQMSMQTLSRLLKNDQHYGIQTVPD